MLQTKFRTHTVIDMYRAWCEKTLAENPEYTKGYDHHMRMPNIKVIYNKKGDIVMNYTMFRSILETYNLSAMEMVIHGQSMDISGNIGYLYGARIEVSFSKVRPDVIATCQIRRKKPDHPVIYKTDDEYLRVKWKRIKPMNNGSTYMFELAKGMKKKFSEANRNNIAIRAQYKFFPLKQPKEVVNGI